MNDEARHSDRHASVCAACGDGGDLICCDGCPTAVHPLCIGMEEVPEVGAPAILCGLDGGLLSSEGCLQKAETPHSCAARGCSGRIRHVLCSHTAMLCMQGDWFCDACTARGRHPRQSKLPPPQQQPKPRCAAKAQSGGRQAKGGASAASGALPRLAGSVGASGRVHMAAPAQRGVSGARRERNSNKHKRLFLPDEPGGLKVLAPLLAHTQCSPSRLAAVPQPFSPSSTRVRHGFMLGGDHVWRRPHLQHFTAAVAGGWPR